MEPAAVSPDDSVVPLCSGTALSRRKGELLPFQQQVLRENTVLRESGQTEKVKNHVISHMWDIKLGATNEQTRKTKTPRHTRVRRRGGERGRGWEHSKSGSNVVTEEDGTLQVGTQCSGGVGRRRATVACGEVMQ